MDVEAEVDRLYELAPEEFVGARNDLVKRLRVAGEREGADRVKGLRRPTVPAWALNQLTRQDPDGVAALGEVRAALAQAQRRLLSGVKDSGLREAMGKRREIVGRLTEAAGTALRESGRDPAPHRQGINATLEAATVDPEAGEQVERGRLERELPPPSGFGDVTGLEVIAPETEPLTAAGEQVEAEEVAHADAEADAVAKQEIAAAREAVEAARRRLRDLRAAAEADRDAAEDARRRADQSDIEATRAERRAELARRQAEADERAARGAARDAEQAGAAAERQAEDLARTERRLAEAEAQGRQRPAPGPGTRDRRARR